METNNTVPITNGEIVYIPKALLTKREHFAALALHGLCASTNWKQSWRSTKDIARDCLLLADDLIAALNEVKE